MNLLPPNSWAERKVAQLHQDLSKEATEDQKFIFIGSCVELLEEHVTEMTEVSESRQCSRKEAADIMRRECVGFDKWCEVMGVDNIESDWSLSFGKSHYRTAPCYWVDHSRIEYIWVDSTQAVILPYHGVTTGRMSCKGPNISNKPRADYTRVPLEQMARQEAASAAAGYPPGDHMVLIEADYPGDSLEEAAKVLVDLADDPDSMKVVPLAISMDSMDKWGCPYCGYHQGQIPITAEGTVLWKCLDCKKTCHVLCDGLERSALAFGGGQYEDIKLKSVYPVLSTHPREGTSKRSTRLDQEPVQESSDDSSEGERS